MDANWIDDLMSWIEDNNKSQDWVIVKKPRRKLVGKGRLVIDDDEDSEIEMECEDNPKETKEMKEMIHKFLIKHYIKEINDKIKFLQKQEKEKEGTNIEAYKELSEVGDEKIMKEDPKKFTRSIDMQIQEMERKKEQMKNDLELYKGKGPKKKINAQSVALKPAYAGPDLCTINAIIIFVIITVPNIHENIR